MSGLQCRGSFRPVNAYRYARCRRSDPGGRGSVSLALRIPRMASFLSVTWACDGDSNAGGASHEGPVLRILKEWGRRSWRVLTNVCFDSRPGYPPHVELRARASAPDPNFDPAVTYELTNLRRLPDSPAVVWDVRDLYVSGTCPQRLAHLTVHFGEDNVENYGHWLTELREWGHSPHIPQYNARSMSPDSTTEYPGNGAEASPDRQLASEKNTPEATPQATPVKSTPSRGGASRRKRRRCRCRCGECAHTPGRLIQCTKCSAQIGPGCCAVNHRQGARDGVCHLCHEDAKAREDPRNVQHSRGNA